MTSEAPAPPAFGLALLLIPLVAFVAAIPLFGSGCSCGHDFDFHILSWMEAATQFSHGGLHLHWAFTPAYNAGEPRFVFYPPLSWTIGGLLGMVMPWTMTPVVYTWLALTAAGLCCYRLLREFVLPNLALLVAALYTVNPYMLFTAYERTAYAELLAAAWLPLLVHAVLRRRVTIAGVALPVALLWLTNAPAAVLGCYGLAFLAVIRLIQTGRRLGARPAVAFARTTLAGTLLGLALAAVYILPAAYERRYVDIAMVKAEGLLVTNNFLFQHTTDPDHDAVLHTASLIAVSLLTVTVVALLFALLRYKNRAQGRDSLDVLSSLLALTVAIALLLTPLSAPIWLHGPQLAYLQFPWRFIAILTPALALALALLCDVVHLPTRSSRAVTLISGMVLAAALVFPAYRVFDQPCDAPDTVAARLALFHSTAGSEPTDEYSLLRADNDLLTPGDPPFWLATGTDAPPPHTAAGPLHWPLDVVSSVPQKLILNLRNYPAWRIEINHRLESRRFPRDDGLIAIPIAAGTSHVEVTYARTADQTAGEALSAASLMALLLLGWPRSRHR